MGGDRPVLQRNGLSRFPKRRPMRRALWVMAMSLLDLNLVGLNLLGLYRRWAAGGGLGRPRRARVVSGLLARGGLLMLRGRC